MRRRKRYPGRGAGVGFAGFVIVIILAVAAGYAGTKFILYPYLLGTGQAGSSEQDAGGGKSVTDSAVTSIPSAPSIIIDQQNLKTGSTNGSPQGENVKNGNSVAGPYSVQFGSFSDQQRAETASVDLTQKGIYSYVYQSGGSFKVLGLPYATEEKAKQAAAVVSAVVSDVFVVNLQDIVP